MVGAVTGLLLMAPLLALVFIVIKLDSKGPALFAQERVGRSRKAFRCYKLRTMAHGTPNVPTHELPRGRVTRVGRFLRSSKMDELPQLWNVLKGEMSLVGPRPSLPSQHELIEERGRRGVLELRPGITGLAQVRGIDMSSPVLVADIDAEYLRRQSLLLDVRIMLSTIRRGSAAPYPTHLAESDGK